MLFPPLLMPIGVDVSLFAAGRIPNSLGGVMENTDIGKVIVDELGFADIMDDITEELKYVMEQEQER